MSQRTPAPRDSAHREPLISAWLVHAESGEPGRSWAYQRLADVIDEDPALAWSLILELAHRAPSETSLALVAAGPLEDLIAWHGEEMIDAIEQRTLSDDRLREALARVWLSGDDLGPTLRERFWRLGVRRI